MKTSVSPQARIILGMVVIMGGLLVCAVALGLVFYIFNPSRGQSGPPAVSPEAAAGSAVPTRSVLAPGPAVPTQPVVGTALPGQLAPVTPLPAVVSPVPPELATQIAAPFTPLPSLTPSSVDIEALLAGMSLEEKIGQMILAGVPGQTYGPQAEQLIVRYHIGGVVYFGENTHSAEQTLRLSQELQDAAAHTAQGVPLLISVDHEGGKVFRFGQGLTHFPNFMTLGAANSADLASKEAAAAAGELLAVGINTSFSPVMDVNSEPLNPVIGVRSLGSDPNRVAEIGVAYLNGLQSAGVIGAAKHFPGHGATATDSHEELPVVNRSLDQLRQDDLVPFKAAIANGVGLVMVGHIAFPQIDPSGAPSSLSPVFVSQVLRQELGYEGVVVTDAMSMGALTTHYAPDQAAIQAALAGCDLLAYTSPDTALAAYNALLNAARQGRLPAAQVDASVRRVLRLKARFGLFGSLPAGGPIPLDAHRSLAYQVARQAITLAGPAQAPLVNTTSLLLVTPDTLSTGATDGDGFSYLGDLLRGRGLQVDEWIYSTSNDGQTATMAGEIQRALPKYPLAVVVTWDARLAQSRGSPAQVDLVKRMFSSGTSVILVAGSSPYDLTLAPSGRPALAMYGGLEIQLEALADALLAATPPGGVLPVSLH